MKKVVLVDDYVDLIEMQKLFIERYNDAECSIFSNPIEALEYVLSSNNVDIVITDYEMPRMNGFTLANKILEKKTNMRIIISSGHDEKTLNELRRKNMLEGKVEVVQKGNMDFFKKLI